MNQKHHRIDRAVVLAAGKGTRMKEHTAELPKPMLEVGGVPILEWIVRGLCERGVKEILLIVGYRQEVVRAHFGDGQKWGVSIAYAVQEVVDGTGKVVELGKEFVGAVPFLLSYGDILVSPENYSQFLNLPNDEVGLIAMWRGEEVRHGGALFLDESGYLSDLIEKPVEGQPSSPYYNAGIYAFTPDIFTYTAQLEKSPRGEYELTDAIAQMVKEGKKIRAIELQGSWADVRDPEILAQLNRERL